LLSKENFTGRAIMAILSIPREDVQQVLEEAHAPGHIGGAKIYDHLMTLGYYWPTMEIDSATFIKRCKVCQLHGNLIHAPAVEPPTHLKPVPSISSGK
jgi:hypothetical protein